MPRILCGDFNSPQEEKANGEVITWGQEIASNGKVTVWGRWKGDTGKRWDSAERNVLLGLGRFDLRDVFRALHGYRRQEFSFYARPKAGLFGRRFDHVFASTSLKPTACIYIHAFREAGLSDHSAIEVTFSLNSDASSAEIA
jgi:exonuclease III